MPFLPDTEPQEGVPRPVLEGTTAGITGTTATQHGAGATAIGGGMGYETGIDAAGGGGTGDAGENGSAPDNITGGVTSPKPPLPPEVQGTGGLY